MQTILGASGQIARELTRELKRAYTDDIRLVSRHPQKVNVSDITVAANLLDAQQTQEAVNGSDTVYFTAGLPPDSALWERQFPTMLGNALEATQDSSILTIPTCTPRATSRKRKRRALRPGDAKATCVR